MKDSEQGNSSPDKSNEDHLFEELLSETSNLKKTHEEITWQGIVNDVLDFYGGVKEAKILENLAEKDSYLVQKLLEVEGQNTSGKTWEALLFLMQLYSAEEDESSQRLTDLIGFNKDPKEEAFKKALEHASKMATLAEKVDQNRISKKLQYLKKHRELQEDISRKLEEARKNKELKDFINSVKDKIT